MPYLSLSISIILSTCRNIFSKKISSVRFGTRPFFICQGVLFLFGGIAVMLFGNVKAEAVEAPVLLFALIYGATLISAQWFYTLALSRGNTALCSAIYSLGFILPTLTGAVIYNESLLLFDVIGIIFASLAVVASATTQKNEQRSSHGYFIPLLVAMLSSGGLGIVQKVQQSSVYAEKRAVFLLIAFFIASLTSFLATFIRRNEVNAPLSKSFLVFAALIGIFFGSCNLLNTKLSGILPSAVFFPTLNIGVIILSLICGGIFFKEKLHKNELAVLILGIASILFLTLL